MNKLLLLFFIASFSTATCLAQNYKFGKVSKAELLQDVHPNEPEANAAILYRSFDTKFTYSKDEGFTASTEFHDRIKIYNDNGNEWATVNIYLYNSKGGNSEKLNGLKAYTYNFDGKIEEIKLEKKNIYEEEVNEWYTKISFTMPNIKTGSVIEYKYSIRSPFLTTFDKYYFQEGIPVDMLDMRFATPEYLSYKTHRNGWIPFTVNNSSREKSISINYKESSDSFYVRNSKTKTNTIRFREDVSEVVLKNVQSLKKEPYSGNLNNYRTTLQFELEMTRFPNDAPESFATSWDEVASDIYKSSGFGSQLNRQGFFKDEVDLLINGVSEKEKVVKIYDYIRNKITWNGNYGIFVENGTASTFKNKSGNMADINLLLVSMLKYAGIKADPILLGTKSHGIYLFPTRTGFNAVIAGVEIDGKLMLLDASDKLASPNSLKSELLNWLGGRLMSEDGTSKAVSLKNAQAIHDAIITVDFDEDGIATASARNRYSSNYAHVMRSKLYGKKGAELNEAVSNSFNNNEVNEVEVSNLNNVHKPLSLSFDTDVTRYFETIGDKIYFNPMVVYGLEENFFKEEDRKLPIDFNYSYLDRINIKINIPSGYVVENLPEPIAVSMIDDIASYKYKISNSPTGLSIVIQRNVKTPLVAVDYYKSLKGFFEMIIKKENEKVVLKKA
ncbi:DUF3857 and transglutaminase domain-containing protein [Dokdonia sp. Asnod1-B02]|uniref:DUF3857 and transglutaminase domain-containing protein n=1 Tax=Dokdonia sp. Asnod1-B02 TaxID=3160573 RepID=UPI00386F48EB